MAAPNLISLGTINAKTALVKDVATGAGSTVIGTVTTSHAIKLNSLIAANKSGSNVTITLLLTRSAVDYTFAYQIVVPTNASLQLIEKGSSIYLEEGDLLKAVAGTASAVDIFASYEDLF